jgi:putative cell wall-binding protein
VNPTVNSMCDDHSMGEHTIVSKSTIRGRIGGVIAVVLALVLGTATAGALSPGSSAAAASFEKTTVSGTVELAAGAVAATGSSALYVDFVAPTGEIWRNASAPVLKPGAPFSIDLYEGDYAVVVRYADYSGTSNAVGEAPFVVSVTAGSPMQITPKLVAPATISGTVSGSHGIPAAVSVGLRDTTLPDYPRQSPVVDTVFDPATGDYTISKVPPGFYEMAMHAEQERWLPEWWRGSSTREGGELLPVSSGAALSDIDFRLTHRAAIEGTVTTTDDSGAVVAAKELQVTIRPESGASDVTTWTDATGHYEILVQEPGRYDVTYGNGGFTDMQNYVPLDHNWATVDGGNRVFEDGTVFEGVDVQVERAGRIDGTITTHDGRSGALVVVTASRWDEASDAWVGYSADPAIGAYSLAGLPPGDYRVRFVQANNQDNHNEYRSEYYPDKLYADQAQLITVRAGKAIASVDARMEKISYSMFRVGGADRYAVAANVSMRTFDPGVPVVYVASGANYPDALSAGPAAAHEGGTLLLVGRDSLPDATRKELERLKPGRIVVVGGPASVSATVYNQLGAFAPKVVRIGGADRYEVSRAVVSYAFCGAVEAKTCPGGAPAAFFATGSNYPDALSAGPAAAHENGPVLLVRGRNDSLDAPTSELIQRLGVAEAYIAGGPNSVTPALEASLTARVGEVTRFSGTDRFDVSTAIAYGIFEQADTVFYASGEKFPDALSGGPAAAELDAPIMLVHHDCVPHTTVAWTTILNPIDIVLLGGPNSLSEGIFTRTSVCPY